MGEDLRVGFESIHVDVGLSKHVFLTLHHPRDVDRVAKDVPCKLKVPKPKK